jgi:hypothetical protein
MIKYQPFTIALNFSGTSQEVLILCGDVNNLLLLGVDLIGQIAHKAG